MCRDDPCEGRGTALTGTADPVAITSSDPAAAFLDWNEDRIRARLWDMSRAAGASHAMMVRVLLNNRGSIHMLYQFEQK